MELTKEEIVKAMDPLSVNSFGECFTGFTVMNQLMNKWAVPLLTG